MTEADLPAFMEVLREVTAVFNVRHDVDVISPAYFKALRTFPIRMVAEGGERCTMKLKRFPKPAEWAEMVPRPTATGVPEMNSFEAADYNEAESLFYEMPPCGCHLCKMAGVNMPLRYVPDTDEPKAKIGDRVVTRGHWAHGVELKRWYAAKEAFWAKARSLGYKSNLLNPSEKRVRPKRAAFSLMASREPGEDG